MKDNNVAIMNSGKIRNEGDFGIHPRAPLEYLEGFHRSFSMFGASINP